jgi:hypothetical protein
MRSRLASLVFAAQPPFDTVKVVGGNVTLPYLTHERTATIAGIQPAACTAAVGVAEG